MRARPLRAGGTLQNAGQASWQFASAVNVEGGLVDAVICASGTRSSDQETPLRPDENGVSLWWPCVVSLYPDYRGLHAFYCPVLAYNKSRPWYAHPSRVFAAVTPAPEVPAFAQSSSVTIEEVDRSSSGKSSTASSAATSNASHPSRVFEVVTPVPEVPGFAQSSSVTIEKVDRISSNKSSSASSVSTSNASEPGYTKVRRRGRWGGARQVIEKPSEAASSDIDFVVVNKVSEDSSCPGARAKADFVKRLYDEEVKRIAFTNRILSNLSDQVRSHFP